MVLSPALAEVVGEEKVSEQLNILTDNNSNLINSSLQGTCKGFHALGIQGKTPEISKLQGCCLKGAQQPAAPKKFLWAPKFLQQLPKHYLLGS